MLPAFDEIEQAYGLTVDSPPVSLTITVFFGSLGIGTLIWGPFADRYGRKPVMFVALVGVIIGAVLSSYAPTFEAFLAGRVLWGIAAAGPRTVILAMTRDSYEGDAMSRIMSLTLALFLIVPILAPALGEVLLSVGSWRWTTLAAAVMAAVGAAWFSRVTETLDPSDALSLRFGRVAQAARIVMTTKHTVLFTIASMMTYAAFFPWLGSSPTLIGDIYDRDSQFAVIFGVNAIAMAVGILITERLVRRYSTYPVIIGQTVLLLLISAIYVATSLSSNGVPPFLLWFALVSALTALNSSSSPLMQSMALQPMDAQAGTAASVIGAAVFLGGAILGSIVDRSINSTVTAFGVGFLAYGLIMAAAIAIAGRDLDPADRTDPAEVKS